MKFIFNFFVSHLLAIAMTFEVLALAVEQFLTCLLNFVTNTWSANLTFLYRFVANSFR